MRAIFVQKIGSKNYKAKTNVEKSCGKDIHTKKAHAKR